MHLLRSLDRAASTPPVTLPRRRLFELAAGCALGMAALTARLFQLQIVEGDEYRARADNNRMRLMDLPPQRGLIYDRNRIPMVRNRPSFAVRAVPADLPDRPEPVYRRLARLIGGNAQEFARLVNRRRGDPFTPVQLAATTDPRTAHTLEERHLELPGIQIEAVPTREYMDGSITSHILGHVGLISGDQLKAAGGDDGPYSANDKVGQSGVESQFEDELRGTAGRKRIEVDATGREVSVLEVNPPRAGNNLVLTIDLALQREVYRIIAERIHQFEIASAVVVDPATGEILSLVHLPAYDNQAFADTIGESDFARLMNDPNRPLLNGAIASAWPPGSCFKIVTALAALHAGVIRPETQIHCGGGIVLPGGARLNCWASHGQQDMISALANSCDTYFYQLAGGEPNGKWNGVGPDALAEWARNFGLGKVTGVELAGEAAGLVPTPDWKQRVHGAPWYRGDTYIGGIGQGFYTATPLQMAMLTAAVANGGTLHRPALLSEVIDERGKTLKRADPRITRSIQLDPNHLRVIREGVRAGMLIGTTPSGARYTGTSFDSNIREIALAGKTGTSEYGTKGPDGKLPTHGWFVFWAPYEAPKLAGAVFVKNGRGAQEAAKVANQIVRTYFGIV